MPNAKIPRVFVVRYRRLCGAKVIYTWWIPSSAWVLYSVSSCVIWCRSCLLTFGRSLSCAYITYSLLVLLFFDICVDWDTLLLCDLCTAVTFDGLVHLELAITEIMKLWLIQDGATVTEVASLLLQYQFASSSNVVPSPCFSILPETCISPNFIRRPHVSVFMNFKLSSGCSTAETEGPGFETGQIALLATALRGSCSGGLTPGRLYLSRSLPMSQMYRYELGP